MSKCLAGECEYSTSRDLTVFAPLGSCESSGLVREGTADGQRKAAAPDAGLRLVKKSTRRERPPSSRVGITTSETTHDGQARTSAEDGQAIFSRPAPYSKVSSPSGS